MKGIQNLQLREVLVPWSYLERLSEELAAWLGNSVTKEAHSAGERECKGNRTLLSDVSLQQCSALCNSGKGAVKSGLNSNIVAMTI